MKMVIELLGISRSGKTTQARLLASALSRYGYQCMTINRPSVGFSSVTMTEDWHRLLFDNLCNLQSKFQDSAVDYLIFDRGYYDRLALLYADYDDGAISLEFRDELLNAIVSKLPSINCAFLFSLSPEQSLFRWSKQKELRLDKSELSVGLITRDNLDGLDCMISQYRHVMKEFAHSHWREIDGLSSVETIQNTIMQDLGFH